MLTLIVNAIKPYHFLWKPWYFCSWISNFGMIKQFLKYTKLYKMRIQV